MKPCALLLVSVLFFYTLGITGCAKCSCCSQYVIGSVYCVNGTSTINRFTGNGRMQTVNANSDDTINYYNSLGYSCKKVIDPDPTSMRRYCSPYLKGAEKDGMTCFSTELYQCGD